MIKNRPKQWSLLLLLAAMASCSSDGFEQDKHTLTIQQGEMTTQITVIDEDILHIVKSKNGVVVNELPDFVTVLEPQDVEWSVEQNDSGYTLKTAQIIAQINDAGEVTFSDKNGKILTNEIADGSYINPDGDGRYDVAQSFAAGDEALYGLGQFQSGVMNWKNSPLRLEQYNQEIVVPFLISTNDYGIYWHNYSVTDFNYPDNELVLEQVKGETKNIRRAIFTPKKSGEYNFMVDSENPIENRRDSLVMLRVGQDTIIHYRTIWIPETFSGRVNLEAGKSYEVELQNTKSQTPGVVLYNEPDFNRSVFSSSVGQSVDYYFIHGENPSKVISTYTDLTGKAPMFDRSVFGFWQCRERYNTQDELLENATQMRKRKIPYDYIVQDWHYWPGGTKGPEWSREKYPNPAAMVSELEKMNTKLMVSVWPEVRNEPLLKKYNLDNKYMGETPFLDFYDKSIHDDYYRMLSDSMFHIGVTAIWLDGTEPERKPADDVMTPLGEYRSVANPYCLLVNKVMYEGKQKEYPNKRSFNLTRSAYAGQQRYGSAVWSGDIAGTWKQFAEQIPAGLNVMMAGIPYWTTDIGGFFRDSKSLNKIYDSQYTNPEYIELLTRWVQFGAFNPLFRIHGFRSNTEIWRYTPEFEKIARSFIDLRYELIPYIYSESSKVTSCGKLLMSPLAYSSPEDKNTWGIKDQFMLGESILVNPVTNYKARERKLYLPDGEWYDFWSGKKIEGGKWITAAAPITSLPLYIKAGAIIPMGEKVQYAAAQDGKPITLKVYPDGESSYSLYLDDSESQEYTKGGFTKIGLSYSEGENTLTIELEQGSDFFAKSIAEQIFNVEVVGKRAVKGVKFTGKKLSVNIK
ncbi:MAG: glycoside hydrolase family 31 protein [Rikenellaceae bacterium]